MWSYKRMFMCSMLAIVSSLLLCNGNVQAETADNPNANSATQVSDVRIHIEPEWIVDDIGEFAGYSSVTVLHMQVWNHSAEAITITPYNGLQKLHSASEDFAQGAVVIGPVATRVRQEVAAGQVVEVSSEESAVLVKTTKAGDDNAYVLAQSVLSACDAQKTAEVVPYILPPDEFHHFTAVIAAKKDTIDLFTLGLVVDTPQQRVIVETPLRVAVMEGEIYAYVLPNSNDEDLEVPK